MQPVHTYIHTFIHTYTYRHPAIRTYINTYNVIRAYRHTYIHNVKGRERHTHIQAFIHTRMPHIHTGMRTYGLTHRHI